MHTLDRIMDITINSLLHDTENNPCNPLPSSPTPQRYSDRPQLRCSLVTHPPIHLKDYRRNTLQTSTSSSDLKSTSIKYPLSLYFTLKFSCLSLRFSYVNFFSSRAYTFYLISMLKIQIGKNSLADEIKALEKNNTRTLTSLLPSKKFIRCMWVYKIKYKSHDSVERYKARLVTKGFTHIEGLDYHENLISVAKLDIVSCLLTVATVSNWLLYQLDVTFVSTRREQRLPPWWFEWGSLHENLTQIFQIGEASCMSSQ